MFLSPQGELDIVYVRYSNMDILSRNLNAMGVNIHFVKLSD